MQITGINEDHDTAGTLTVEVTDGGGRTTSRWRRELPLPRGVHRLLEEEIDTAEMEGPFQVHARLTSAGGEPVAEGHDAFDVFSERQLIPPKGEIAVLDPGKRLQPFLESRGVALIDFGTAAVGNAPVLATRPTAGDAATLTAFEDLAAFARAGGTVVYVDGLGGDHTPGQVNRLQERWFPFQPRIEPARGLWTCIPHLVLDHPIFEGLPAGGPMRDLYQNVWATTTLRELGGEAVVASVGFDWYSRTHQLQYRGPGGSWWGADVAVLPHGEGRIVVSELRLLPHLGEDPVADKLLFNLIRFAAE